MNAAMIREEWLTKAIELLPNPADRCHFYEAIMYRAFGQSGPAIANPIAAAMFKMVEGAISADITKYETKCKRNRENAQKRVATSRYQSLRVVASRSESIPMASNRSQIQV